MQIDRVAELFEPGFELMELDPMANLFATLVATAFHIGIRFISKMEIIGLENYPGSPSTLVITNHKRDLDMLVIGPTLHFGDLFPRLGKTIFCGSRDEFAPSFLATYYNVPQWLNRMILYKLDISPVMYAFRVYPMRQAHGFTNNKALREVLQRECNVELGTIS